MDHLYHLVDQSYRERDWGTLGYTTWQECVEKELGITSNGQTKVEWVLEEAATPSQPGLTSDEWVTIGLNEKEAPNIKLRLPNVVEDVRQAVAI